MLMKGKMHGNTLLHDHGQTMSLTFAITLLDNVGGVSADDLVVSDWRSFVQHAFHVNCGMLASVDHFCRMLAVGDWRFRPSKADSCSSAEFKS